MGHNLIRTTVRLLPSQSQWLEDTAKQKERAAGEVLRECVAVFLRKRHPATETYASGTRPKAVYLGRAQIARINARCKTYGGTMSGIIRRAIAAQMSA